MLFNIILCVASCFKVPHRKAFITQSLAKMPPPNTSLDFIIYNTSEPKCLEPDSLDTLLVDTSNTLNTMGTVFFNSSDTIAASYYYNYLLKNPEELWNYNLVSIKINGNKITARKGSSVIFKTRKMLEFSKEFHETKRKLEEEEENVFSSLGFIVLTTGDSQIDWLINFAGVIIQYSILFNFFSFGLYIFTNTFFNNGNY
tara:strand:+ start:148 stop:747 length:600 start_codon:yes stop_codon:yes gene_type:complete